jgi:hypothetical protein
MCHHLALLDIRLRYPHVVLLCLYPDSKGPGMCGRVSVNRQLTQPCKYVNTGVVQMLNNSNNNKSGFESCAQRNANLSKSVVNSCSNNGKGRVLCQTPFESQPHCLVDPEAANHPVASPPRSPSSLLQGLFLTRQPDCSVAGGY